MRLCTFAIAGSLAVSTWAVGGVLADDASTSAPSSETTESIAPADRGRVQKLLRQALADVEAGRFDSARRLARQAAQIPSDFGLFDIRPEHVYAEIDRQQRKVEAARLAGDAPTEPIAGDARETSARETATRATSTGARPSRKDEMRTADTRAPAARPNGARALPARAAAGKTTPAADDQLQIRQTAFGESESDPGRAENALFHSEESAASRQPAAKLPAGDAPVDLRRGPVQREAASRFEAGVAKGPVAGSGDARTRAIALLDRGLLALDENRLDEAERLAHQAARLHAEWEKFDYRPEHLLAEIGKKRKSASPGKESSEPAASDSFATRRATNDLPHGESATGSARTLPHERSSSSVTSAARAPGSKDLFGDGSEEERADASIRPPSAPRATPAASATSSAPPAATTRHTPAEKLLEDALIDLHAGRDRSARLRIEQALGLVSSGARPVASAGNASGSGLRPSGKSQGFFPLHRADSIDSGKDAEDSLAPLHDPFLGDAPQSTAASSAGERRLREASPRSASLPPGVATRGDSSATSGRVRQASYESPAIAANPPATSRPVVMTRPDSPAISPQVGWLERMSTPIGPQGSIPNGGGAVPGHIMDGRPAPIAPPIVPQGRWGSPGRAPYPPVNDASTGVAPFAPPAPERPGLFERVWSAMRLN